MHKLLPTVQPFLETFLESYLWNLVHLGRRIPHNVFSWLKSDPFQRNLQFGEKPKITRSHVGRIGSLTNQGNVVFSQKTLKEVRKLGGCIVVMEMPRFCCPRFWSFASHSFTKATNYPLVVLFGEGLVFCAYSWCTKLREPRKPVNKTLTLLRTCCAFFGFGYDECLHWGLRICFWVVPVNPRLLTSYHGVQEVGITFYAVQHVLCDFQAKLLMLNR